MTSISQSLRRFVYRRARGRCEYCRLSQKSQVATFHIDHIVPLTAGGLTDPANLALACVTCSLRKGARQAAVDPISGRYEPLFHPRREFWATHFRKHKAELIGMTPTGRATIAALQLNHARLVKIRRKESLRHKRYPPTNQA